MNLPVGELDLIVGLISCKIQLNGWILFQFQIRWARTAQKQNVMKTWGHAGLLEYWLIKSHFRNVAARASCRYKEVFASHYRPFFFLCDLDQL